MDIQVHARRLDRLGGARPGLFAALFRDDGSYHNTPFRSRRATQSWRPTGKRVLAEDVKLSFEILANEGSTGIAHWHVTYQVASEELFRIWASSTGTSLPSRQPGDALPRRMVLDGVLQARFADGLCAEARIWWHSMPEAR